MVKMESQELTMQDAAAKLEEIKKARGLATTPGNVNAVALSLNKAKESITLCVDLSGSMSLRYFEITRGEAAKKAMDAIIKKSDSKITQYGLVSFTHEAYEVLPMGTIFARFLVTQFSPTGGTNMYYALQKCLSQDPKRIIVLSDGETPDVSSCIRIARETYQPRGIKIDTVAIGEASDQFLMELSELTGGHFQRAGNPAELEKAFEQLETKAYLQIEHK